MSAVERWAHLDDDAFMREGAQLVDRKRQAMRGLAVLLRRWQEGTITPEESDGLEERFKRERDLASVLLREHAVEGLRRADALEAGP